MSADSEVYKTIYEMKTKDEGLSDLRLFVGAACQQGCQERAVLRIAENIPRNVMADRVAIQAEERTIVGKKVKRLRREGWVPAVIYGQEEPLSVQVNSMELRRALRQAGTTELIDVTVGAKQRTVLARDIQQHLTRGDIIHVDFYEVNLQQTIIMDVSLSTIGVLPAKVSGLGTVSLILQSVQLESLPTELPSFIEVELSLITDPETSIYVKDLQVPPGVKILSDPDMVITTFSYTRIEEEEEEEEEELMFAPSADAVEVIKKGKEDEEEF